MAKKQNRNDVPETTNPKENPVTDQNSVAPSGATLHLSTKTQKGVSSYIYEVPGRRGLVYVPKSFFVTPPERLTFLDVALDAPTTPVVGRKLTDEEKAAAKAARAAMTPAEKAEAARQQVLKAAARLAKLQAAIPVVAE